MPLKKVIAAALLVLTLAWLLPNHYSPWPAAYQDFLSFSMCLLALASLTLIKKVYAPASAAVILSVSFLPLIQHHIGIIYFAGDAWIATFYLSGFLATFVVGFNLQHQGHGEFITTSISVAFLVGAMASFWLSIIQWLSLFNSIWIADLPQNARPFANLAQPNNLSTLLCLGIASILYLLERDHLHRITAGLTCSLLIFGVALTQSRTPWLSSILAIIFLYWKIKTGNFRLSTNRPIMWFTFYVVLVFILPTISDALLLQSSDPAIRAHSLERFALWHQLWQAVLQGPLWGYGWNQVSIAQIGATPNFPVPILVEHSHNLLIDVLIWNGPIIGGLLIISTSVWLLNLYWRAQSKESNFALLGAGLILTHALLEFPLEYAFFLFPMGIMLGIANGEHRPVWKVKISRPLLMATIASSTLFLAWTWKEYRIIEEDYRLLRFETARIGTRSAEHSAPKVILLTQLRELIRFARTEAREGMSEEELEWMRKVVYRYPYPPSLFRYALALSLNGKTSEAYEQMAILRNLHPIERYNEGVNALSQMQKKNPKLQALSLMLSI